MTETPKQQYARLFNECRPLAAAILRRILFRIADDTEIDDLVQDVFERAYRTFENHEGEHFRPWLSVIAKNCAFDRLRRERSRIRTIYDRRSQDPDPTRLARNDDDPLRDLLAQEVRAEMIRRMSDLSKFQREAVLLRYVHGLDVERIAKIQRVPVNTSKSRLRYGIVRLRQLLGVEIDSQRVPVCIPRRRLKVA